MSALDLLGDPLPDYTPELPVKEQFSYFDDLVGHTIKAVFCPPTGKRYLGDELEKKAEGLKAVLVREAA